MRHPAERGTRERILEVAEASLGASGYHGTRLHHIAREVGIQKASLFHYFPSKEHLYRAVLSEGFGQTEQTIRRVLETEGSQIEKVRTLVTAYVQMVAAHPERTKILLRQSLGDAPTGHQGGDPERLLRLVASYIEDAQQANIFAPIDPLAVVLAVVGMVAFFFTSAPVLAPSWLDDPFSPVSVERVTNYVVAMVERSLTAHEVDHGAQPPGSQASAAAAQGDRGAR
jgi:AcrR family transcriptional regulator